MNEAESVRTIEAVRGGSSPLCLLQLLSPHWKEKEQLILTGRHHQNTSIAKFIHPAFSPSRLSFQWRLGADPQTAVMKDSLMIASEATISC